MVALFAVVKEYQNHREEAKDRQLLRPDSIWRKPVTGSYEFNDRWLGPWSLE